MKPPEQLYKSQRRSRLVAIPPRRHTSHGERRKRLLPAVLILAVLGPLFAPWRTVGGNKYGTYNSDLIPVKNGHARWILQSDAPPHDPVPAEGMLITADSKRRVFALDQESGRTRWVTDLQAWSKRFGIGKRRANKIKHIIINDDRVLVSDVSILYSLDLWSGRPVWARRHSKGGIYASPFAAAETIFYGTRRAFYARQRKNGHIHWTRTDLRSYSAHPAGADGRLFALSRNLLRRTYTLHRLDPGTGQTVWRAALPRPFRILAAILCRDSVILPVKRTLLCLRQRDGHVMWRRDYPFLLTGSAAYTNGRLLISADNSDTAVLNPQNGRLLYRIQGPQRGAPRRVCIGDRVYVSDNLVRKVGGRSLPFARVRAFRLGEEKAVTQWSFTAPFPGAARQPVAAGGTLFLPAGKFLYALGTYYQTGTGRDYRLIRFRPPGRSNEGPTRKLTIHHPAGRKGVTVFLRSRREKPNRFEKRVVLREPKTVVTVPKGEPLDVIIGGTHRFPRRRHIPPDRSTLTVKKPQDNDAPISVRAIRFATDSAELKRRSLPVLRRIASYLRRRSDLNVTIAGHTDNRGSDAYNLRLSRRRARAVKTWLVKNGVGASRMRTAGYGETKPTADNKTEKGRALNRRTDFTLEKK